jgi:hypothetical protein
MESMIAAGVASARVARSIHTTRRQLEELAEDDYLDRDHKRGEVRRLRASLAKKRRIKAQVMPTVEPVVIPMQLRRLEPTS